MVGGHADFAQLCSTSVTLRASGFLAFGAAIAHALVLPTATHCPGFSFASCLLYP
jgi:hypothetical protein